MAESTRRISLGDLVNGAAATPQDTRFATIGVRRATKREDYSVPTEEGNGARIATPDGGGATAELGRLSGKGVKSRVGRVT